MRAQNDAIMVGVGTALADDPMLTCRLPGMEKYSPVRIVLDSELRLPRAARLARSARETPLLLIAGTGASPAAAAGLQVQGAKVLRVSANEGRFDLSALLKLLARDGMSRVMVEGGPTLAAALIAADLVDAAVLFHSPKVVGADGIDALDVAATSALTQRLECVMKEAVGADRRDVYERK
jgi:diaminohydroxyphosphoribosylaminopyrimidine deaminase / 5-amino-6-(5-phosphoribosylamino)uracil reductase